MRRFLVGSGAVKVDDAELLADMGPSGRGGMGPREIARDAAKMLAEMGPTGPLIGGASESAVRGADEPAARWLGFATSGTIFPCFFFCFRFALLR